MKNKLEKFSYYALGSIAALPLIASAQTGWVTCGGVDCNWNSFVAMIGRVMNNLYILAFSIAIIFFAYAGFLILTSGGDAGKRKRAKDIFLYVVIGFVVMFFSYAFVVWALRFLGVDASFFKLLVF